MESSQDNKCKEKILCPTCGGKGYYFVKKFIGNDIYDDGPRYYNSLTPCLIYMKEIRVKRDEYL